MQMKQEEANKDDLGQSPELGELLLSHGGKPDTSPLLRSSSYKTNALLTSISF
jgi:hypothetical protein